MVRRRINNSMKQFQNTKVKIILPLAASLATIFQSSVSIAGGLIGRQIVADFQSVQGTNNHFEAECVGAGRAGELLRKVAVEQLRDVHDNCGFKYLRFHGLFHDDMGVYSEISGHPVFNFQYTDLAYDAIIDTGMKPLVELGFMPAMLASGTKTIFWWKANVTLPKDYSAWARLVREFTSHVEQRYGRDEVKQWYFEVWNEPNRLLKNGCFFVAASFHGFDFQYTV
jgi:xylan 1,4-beta-xylosidase